MDGTERRDPERHPGQGDHQVLRSAPQVKGHLQMMHACVEADPSQDAEIEGDHGVVWGGW